MDYHSEHVMNLANSIIGVSILAMPYCFKQCGIILSILLLFISSVISRLSCHFLLKSAILARRKTFEFLAFHAFGSLGKFIIEIGIIGFMLGTCIAFFVVMGDLGPEIISEITGSNKTGTMRTSILMALALFCVLPLGLLRKVDSLAGVSKATIGFYCCLVLKIVVESAPHFVSGEWLGNVELWRPAGILQCLPIFSMALFCQTQLFEIYQSMPNASLEKMNDIIRIATNICTFVYIFVGMFGYIAFHKVPFTGNILLSFRPSAMTDAMKLGFVLSLAFSFPLVIFPCRASMYSLIYKQAYSVHEGSASNYIPEGKYKSLTFIIVFFSLLIGVLIPSIELVLGLIGSTIGVMICVVFPVTCFICVSPKNTNERLAAQLMLFVGIMVMVLGTYANLYAIEEINIKVTEKPDTILKDNFVALNNNKIEIQKAVTIANNIVQDLPVKEKDENKLIKIKETVPEAPKIQKEVRHEPPQPEEPQDSVVSANNLADTQAKSVKMKEKLEQTLEKQNPVVEPALPKESKLDTAVLVEKSKDEPEKSPSVIKEQQQGSDVKERRDVPADKQKKSEEVDIEAIRKEESELKEQAKVKEEEEKRSEQALLDTLKKHSEVQMKIVEQQQQLLEVLKQQQQALVEEKQKDELQKVEQKKLEAAKQIESIAKKAIESLGVKETEKKPVDKAPEEKAEVISEKSAEANQESKKEVKLVPLPIAVSNNLKMDGQPRQEKKQEMAQETRNNQIKPSEQTFKQNEININQVDNMNINIKHEINLNVDGKASPKTLIDLLNGKVNQDRKKETAVENPANVNDNNKERSEIPANDPKNDAVPTSINSNGNQGGTESPLIELANKLSETDLKLKNLNIPDVQPVARDLKYFQAKM